MSVLRAHRVLERAVLRWTEQGASSFVPREMEYLCVQ
jgi:hypothetical protein